eukprot:TRINITY_DN3245_c0_g1_i1.p1 TRINITY_DN3245_c0_g1~~TRINITY_DN3245_c0_g1_i1.p1  ORF type:complete len:835 (+),score=277.52 TRINITY_DN3245_c0_g1_i1:81-2585(+)
MAGSQSRGAGGNLSAFAVQFVAVYSAALLWFLGGSTWLWGDLVANTSFGNLLVKEMHVRPVPAVPNSTAGASTAAILAPWLELSPEVAGELEFGLVSALTHTVLLLGGSSLSGWQRDMTKGWVRLATPVVTLCGVFWAVRLLMVDAFEREGSLVHRWSRRWWFDDGAESFALLASGSMTTWMAAAFLIPYCTMGDGNRGALPSNIARYLIWLLLLAVGAVGFFSAVPKVLALVGEAPDGTQTPMLTSATHVASLCSGVVACSIANVCVRLIGGGWSELTARRSTLVDLSIFVGLCSAFAAVVAKAWWPTLAGTETVAATVSAARAFVPLPRSTVAALSDSAVYVLSYQIWFAAGVLFELVWPNSATNTYHRSRKPRRRSWTLRLITVAAIGAVSIAWDVHKRCEEAGVLGQAAAAAAVMVIVYVITRPSSGRGAKWGTFTGRDYAAPAGSAKRKRVNALRQRCGDFPPPYPNGWYRACLSDELRSGGNPITVSMLSTEIVLFRGEDGVAGAVHAYCPHLGTHLGGAEVRGCRLVCPYHEWAFRADGKCEDIPYHPAGAKIPERASVRGYPVKEVCGIVWVWYHPDRTQPLWGLDEPEHVDDPANGYRFVADIPFGPDWQMHVMEPSQNSADWYHFNTVHRYLTNPLHPQLLKVDHTLRAYFTGGVSGGSGPRETEGWERMVGVDKMPPSHLYVRETIRKISVMGLFDLPSFVASFFSAFVKVQSPQQLTFCINTKIGNLRGVTTLQPLEPFRQRGRLRLFCNGWMPGIVARALAHQICETANQDREIWEHKMHVAPRNLVAGDGPFVAYGHWLKQFYCDSSIEMKDAVAECSDW